MFSSALPKLLTKKSLNFRESLALFDEFFSGRLNEAACKTILVLLSQKGVEADEMLGCLKALSKYEPPAKVAARGLLDTCGTGGDKSSSLNISTLAAIVAAGAGVKVAKHGNRAFTSKCGSSDLMESFGVNLNASAKTMIKAIKKNGFAYFHAPAHHPVVAKFQGLRKKLKIKTILNLVGPLTNPLALETKMVGTADEKTFHLYAKIFSKMKFKRALVVYSPKEHMDEISGASPSKAALIEKGRVKYFKIDPANYGMKKVSPNALKAASATACKSKARKILSGKETGAAATVVMLNSGTAIWTAGKAATLKEGIEMAYDSVHSGKAMIAIETLAANSRQS